MKMGTMEFNDGFEFGLYTLGDHMPNPHTRERISAQQRISEIIELATLADQAGIDFFSVGESHQEYFTTQAHAVVLGAIAQATKNIKIASSSTIVSTSDPVRVYENFATIDLISGGRAELIAGRASRIGLFELLGYNVADYEELYEEKFDLLRKINTEERVTWSGNFRAPLKDAQVLPRPVNRSLPIWRAVGGPPASAIKAGRAGVPMMLATLGGPVESYKHTIDVYRQTALENGHDPSTLPVATAGFFYVAETTQQAIDEMHPYIDEGMKRSNGRGFPKFQFMHGAEKDSVMNVGSPQQIIEKILYQREQYGHQRYIGQMDFGGMPFSNLMKNVELIGNDILPAIKKYTK
ncbi:LLM class flavin-dependent oxidoreductase [Paenisporosarcina cavernae]|uniref:LLM class flavin-dependent oxidoreductase n=1 Tax=Paenisporosarcina cavernae TaxID=2320858 RepID=A0A385YVM0_9BACL|nr:LLM class flavin-dependent oxidoreductase [Paenisporosarcina cavernae]AYC30521.1 LLM class flavin-dependent oxidoreductase [Paenisporosarcina cavernae]